jgi:putative DNA primase/helicase
LAVSPVVGCTPIVAPPTNEDQTLKEAALSLAGRGIPVFPCKPDKSPCYLKSTLEQGHLDATTDRDLIAEWWDRWPEALIGMPTGSRSGVWVLDVDDPEALARLPHGLPQTYTVATPHDEGLHYYFRHVRGVTTSSGSLPEGLDVRGEGGYVIVPPSPGYRVLNSVPVAHAPAWLLESIFKPEFEVIEGEGRTCHPRESRFVLPERIREGQRNKTLHRYGCSLRAQDHSYADILAELRRVSREVCDQPPGAGHELGDREVQGIARSAARHRPGTTNFVTHETLAALEAIEAAVLCHPWPGMGGGSERDVMVALIKAAHLHGRLIPAGVRISLDFRSLADAAGMSTSSAHRAVQRLRRKDNGWVRYDNEDRRIADSSALVLVHPPSAITARKPGHSTSSFTPLETPCSSSATESESVPPCAPRLRWGGSLGKRCGELVDVLERAGGKMAVTELAQALGVKRLRDLRRRYFSRLEEAGVVEYAETDDNVRLCSDWLEALERERERNGEKQAGRMQRKQHEWQREAFRQHLQEKFTEVK